MSVIDKYECDLHHNVFDFEYEWCDHYYKCQCCKDDVYKRHLFVHNLMNLLKHYIVLILIHTNVSLSRSIYSFYVDFYRHI